MSTADGTILVRIVRRVSVCLGDLADGQLLSDAGEQLAVRRERHRGSILVMPSLVGQVCFRSRE